MIVSVSHRRPVDAMNPVSSETSGVLKALLVRQPSYEMLSLWEETWKTYLLAKVCCLASRVTILSNCATLVALAWVTHLSTVTINRTGLVAFLASCALLAAVTLAVLVTPEVCCTILLTVATAAVLIALLFGSDYHLLASTQLSDKKQSGNIANGGMIWYYFTVWGRAWGNNIRLSLSLSLHHAFSCPQGE